ncbi:MAG: cupin domain-containing protein [Dongiaceae bacterium]
MEKFNIQDALATATPGRGLQLLTSLNDTQIKVGKFHGRFAWHRHEREDELFWVWRGRLTIQFRDREVCLAPGEMLVVPAGVEHRSIAAEEADVIVIHPASTIIPNGNPPPA